MMKPKRIVDEELLETVRQLPCLACASIDPDGARAALHDDGIRSHPHHLYSRGAGGNDVPENLMPLCFNHHRMVHSKGLSVMAYYHPVIKNWLISAGWTENKNLTEHGLMQWDAPASCFSK
jgi:hypothetical protein